LKANEKEFVNKLQDVQHATKLQMTNRY